MVWFYQLPIWVVAVLFVTLLFLAMEAGFRVGLREGRANKSYEKLNRGDVTLGSMFALLGLLLAFTYSFALNRADLRKQVVVAEANAIGTAFLRADLAEEPGRTVLRQTLLDYARSRVITPNVANDTEQARQVMARSLGVQAKLWPATKLALQGDLPVPVQTSIVQSINEVLDQHSRRVAIGFDRLPALVLFLLVIIAAVTLAIAANNAGQLGGMNRRRMNTFALILAALMVIIVDFDQPFDELILGNNDSLVDLVQNLEATIAE